ncbi:MAG: SOS response-associated peptidase, partial [Spirochaetes bacterium]|nr:SOS response-associated peptidase [Spirochaetota bacterium]
FLIDDVLSDIVPTYNITPGSNILSIIMRDSKRLLVDFKWGLVPAWAKDPSIGQKMINARGETVSQKPSFRKAFKLRRCLIVASGFYEWKGEGKIKIPYYIRLASNQPFGFAGLYETWISREGMELHSCTIITTEANDVMKPIHDRMPVIIPRRKEDLWISSATSPDEAQGLLMPYQDEEMTAYPVSTIVNSPKNNSAECITPL